MSEGSNITRPERQTESPSDGKSLTTTQGAELSRPGANEQYQEILARSSSTAEAHLPQGFSIVGQEQSLRKDIPNADGSRTSERFGPDGKTPIEFTKFGPDNKPLEQTKIGSDGKTPTEYTKFNADGSKDCTKFGPDGKTPGEVTKFGPDGKPMEQTLFATDGKTPREYTRFNADGTKDCTRFADPVAELLGVKGLPSEQIKFGPNDKPLEDTKLGPDGKPYFTAKFDQNGNPSQLIDDRTGKVQDLPKNFAHDFKWDDNGNPTYKNPQGVEVTLGKDLFPTKYESQSPDGRYHFILETKDGVNWTYFQPPDGQEVATNEPQQGLDGRVQAKEKGGINSGTVHQLDHTGENEGPTALGQIIKEGVVDATALGVGAAAGAAAAESGPLAVGVAIAAGAAAKSAAKLAANAIYSSNPDLPPITPVPVGMLFPPNNNLANLANQEQGK